MSINELSPDVLNSRRMQAVKLRLKGVSLNIIQSSTGLTHPTIISAHKAFLKGGWVAVAVKDRGRPKSDNTQRRQIQKLWQKMYSSKVTGQSLWDIEKVQSWLLSSEQLNISTKTIARLISKWGIKANDDKPITPTHRTNEKLYFASTVSVKTNFDLDSVSSKTYALCAQNSKGKLFWSCFENYLTEDMLLKFCQLIKEQQIDDKITTIYLQSYPLNKYTKLNDWLNAQLAFNLIVINTGEEKKFEHNIAQKNNDAPSIQPLYMRKTMALTHLERLESESIQIMREVISKTENPVMLYSVGKDSAVMLHLAIKAFYPSKPPFSFLHVDTGWKFREMYEFRDQMAKDLGIDLIVYKNLMGVEQNINPFTHGSALHTDIMKTQALKQALNKYKFDAAFGGARRDEEKSRAKERIFSFRTTDHRWDPKKQRPELWKNYNANKNPGESIRVFPISNWTELDIWQYIYLEKIPVVPLYLSASRPVVERDGSLTMVDDERMPMLPGEVPMMRDVRFRTLGCYPLTGAIESTAKTLPDVIQEMLLAKTSEREGRMIDKDSFASMEKKKQEGYF
jgi:sulfate adenylyltransferase subunit 2